ncbi:uncharacterized protein E0L32_012036 [Thyridium curvatum]|uniref:Ubiquitin-like protease family profile domain-containing protein n=1 Tax=Thyridium curvatum TaxID=1093900 RepID=A0A507BCN4_9PEZI|nr:uncharacterized protein E0L32_012036 [Thyridium curvatum]TPX17657.1 hypothetical protein E0L32_012036 [Thyridium curvatum]
MLTEEIYDQQPVASSGPRQKETPRTEIHAPVQGRSKQKRPWNVRGATPVRASMDFIGGVKRLFNMAKPKPGSASEHRHVDRLSKPTRAVPSDGKREASAKHEQWGSVHTRAVFAVHDGQDDRDSGEAVTPVHAAENVRSKHPKDNSLITPVDEYRAIDKHIGPKRRSRPPRNQHTSFSFDKYQVPGDSIRDDSGSEAGTSVQASSPRAGPTQSPHFPSKLTKGAQSHPKDRTSLKRHFDDSIDELAYEAGDQPPKKITVRNQMSASTSEAASSSLSRRGDMANSKFLPSLNNRSRRRFARPLVVQAASCGLVHNLRSKQGGMVCKLKLDPANTVLRAVDSSGACVPELDWLEPKLEKMKTVKFNPKSPFVTIYRSAQVGAGGKLHLQFGEVEHATAFIDWVQGARAHQIICHQEESEILRREFEISWQQIELHLEKAEAESETNTLRHARGSIPKPEIASKPPIGTLNSRESSLFSRQTRSLRRSMRGEEETMPPTPNQTTGASSQLFDIHGSRLRRTANSSKPLMRDPSLEPDRWTTNHPEWARDWIVPLTYLRTTVDKDDIPRLDAGQFLNDNLIMFYLRYLQDRLERENPAVANRIYFHNSFFYEKLKLNKGRGVNYDGVKKWTSKIDLFSYDYIVVPVNENAHWWVAILCNMSKLLPRSAELQPEVAVDGIQVVSVRDGRPWPKESLSIDLVDKSLGEALKGAQAPKAGRVPSPGNMSKAEGDQEDATGDAARIASDLAQPPDATTPRRLKKGQRPSLRKYDPKDPKIITLDSLGATHPITVGHLKEYLVREIKERKGIDIPNPGPLGVTAKNIPLQDNFCDCGIYLLGYIQEFLRDPDLFVKGILQREDHRWAVDAKGLRNELRSLIFKLQKQHQDEEMQRKQQRKRMRQSREPGTEGESASPKDSRRAATEIPGPSTPGRVASAATSRRTTPGVGAATLDFSKHDAFEREKTSADSKISARETPAKTSPGRAGSGTCQRQVITVEDDNLDLGDHPAAAPQEVGHGRLSSQAGDEDVKIIPSIELVDVEDSPPMAPTPMAGPPMASMLD